MRMHNDILKYQILNSKSFDSEVRGVTMFSEKYKYKSERMLLIECVSESLRNRVWNLFFQNDIYPKGIEASLAQLNGVVLIENQIADKLGIPLKTSINSYKDIIRDLIIKDWEWYEIYDFVEIHLSVLEDDQRQIRMKQYNTLFEEEKSGYRVVNGKVTPITNENEIETIENAIASPFSSVNEHISKALDLYSDLENPDYENSIKESISAVEAMCCIISGKNQTLNKALADLKNSGIHIHPCMENAFKQLYAYTSDEKGIRHAGMEFVSAPAEDAKYMLISCSSFVNYLIEKWSKVQQD